MNFKNIFKAGNKKTGLLISLFLILMIFSSTIFSFLINPLYFIQYVTTILLFGQAGNLFLLITLLFLNLWYFMNLKIKFITKKRAVGFILFLFSIIFFILTIILIISNQFGLFRGVNIVIFYEKTFFIQINNIKNITNLNFDYLLNFNLIELGIIFPLPLWIISFSGYFMPMLVIFMTLLLLYSLNIIFLDDYRLFLRKLNLFTKEDISVKKKLNKVDLNQPTEEFEIHFSKEQIEKNNLIKKVRENMDKKSYEELSNKIFKEKEKLISLRNKVIKKIKYQNNNQKEKPSISDEQRKEIINKFGGRTSYSKIKMQYNEKNNKFDFNNNKNVSVAPKNNKSLSDDLLDDIATEIISNSSENQEIQSMNNYYEEIFNNENKLEKQVQESLKTNTKLKDDEKNKEVIIDNLDSEVSVEEYLNLPNKIKNTQEQRLNIENYSNKNNLKELIEVEKTIEKVLRKQEKIEISSKNEVVHSKNWCKKYVLPSTSILTSKVKTFNNQTLIQEINNKSKSLNNLFSSFNVKASVNSFEIGPTVSTFKIELEQGIKTTKVTNLEDNIKLNLGAEYIRILAPIPGASFIGIEVPNSVKNPVLFKNVYDETNSNDNKGIQISIGQDVSGKPLSFDLTKAPHLLVAGSTGSGKSIAINTILASILLRYKPTEVQMILIDPKMVEFAPFHGIPHLLSEVIIDASNANNALKAMVQEMEERYKIMAQNGAKKIEELNEILISRGEDKLPYIVIVIDELADLMMVAAKEVEESIMRITQKARASGIHMILATQRPSTEIITGTIKSNIPSRISFTVASSIDSRTILGMVGAEKLIGMGDMLISLYGKLPIRGQGAYISNNEIEELTSYIKSQCSAEYIIDVENLVDKFDAPNLLIDTSDPIYIAARDIIIKHQKASTSMIQRYLNIGYNKAATIIDTLENEGVIGPSKGSKPREVLEN